MIYRAYSIRDVAVGAFHIPIFFRSDAEAVRSFTDACNDPKGQFSAHPADYALFYVGAYNDADGVLVGESAQLVVQAMSLIGNNG